MTEWHNPNPGMKTCVETALIFCRKWKAMRPVRNLQPHVLWNPNLSVSLGSPHQSFITWDELGWHDYPLIVSSCILQYRNGILIGTKGENLERKEYCRSSRHSGTRQASNTQRNMFWEARKPAWGQWYPERQEDEGQDRKQENGTSTTVFFSHRPQWLQWSYPLNPIHWSIKYLPNIKYSTHREEGRIPRQMPRTATERQDERCVAPALGRQMHWSLHLVPSSSPGRIKEGLWDKGTEEVRLHSPFEVGKGMTEVANTQTQTHTHTHTHTHIHTITKHTNKRRQNSSSGSSMKA